MDRGGEKPVEGTEEVVSAEKYLGTGRMNHAGVGSLIQDGDTGGSSIWEGDLGDKPPHGMSPGVLPEWSGETDYGTSTTAASRRKTEEPLIGVGYTVGGLGGGRGICPEEAEYDHSVHYDTTDYKPL